MIFNLGDTVRVAKDTKSLTKGDLYTVIDPYIEPKNGDEAYCIRVKKKDSYREGAYYHWKFEPVRPPNIFDDDMFTV